MATYRLTPDAIGDLEEIDEFIAADSAEAADRVQEAILKACSELGRHPLLGSVRADLTTQPVRFWTVPSSPNYIVVYRPDTTPLQVIRELHGRRNLKSILRHSP